MTKLRNYLRLFSKITKHSSLYERVNMLMFKLSKFLEYLKFS